MSCGSSSNQLSKDGLDASPELKNMLFYPHLNVVPIKGQYGPTLFKGMTDLSVLEVGSLLKEVNSLLDRLLQ